MKEWKDCVNIVLQLPITHDYDYVTVKILRCDGGSIPSAEHTHTRVNVPSHHCEIMCIHCSITIIILHFCNYKEIN